MTTESSPIVVQRVEDLKDLAVVHALEREVWGGDDLVPVSLLRVMAIEGGQVLVARHRDQGEPVGMAVAFVGRRGQQWYLHSHMVAVKAAFRSMAVGRRLKQHQLDYARSTGLDYVGWTFDPLQRKNAQFNLNVVGGVVTAFYENFYGSLDDRINSGFATHRLFVEWNGIRLPKSGGRFVAVPDDIGRLRAEHPERARAWAERHRKKWERLIQDGFGAVALVPGRWGLWFYRLQRIVREGKGDHAN